MLTALLDVPLDQARWAAFDRSQDGYVREYMDLLLQSERSPALENVIQLMRTQADSPHSGLSALLCVSVKGFTYSILNDRSTVPPKSDFQQVSSPYDWYDEFNKRQGNGTKPGIQSASGQNNEAEADTKGFAGTANRTSQSASGWEDKGVGSDEELRERV